MPVKPSLRCCIPSSVACEEETNEEGNSCLEQSQRLLDIIKIRGGGRGRWKEIPGNDTSTPRLSHSGMEGNEKMRVFSIAFVSLIATWLGSSGISVAEIHPATVVGIWLFDEGQGSIARDSSGEGHDGEIGEGIKWTDGQYGSKALHFPGNAVVIVPHEESLNLVTWTVTAWIRAEFHNGWVEFVSKSVPVGNTDFRNYVLQIENDTGLLRPHFTQGAQQWKLTAGTTDLRDDEWHHVAGTYDQNFIRAYVDGELEGEAAFSNVPDTNEEPLVFGAITPAVNFFTGAIDEVGLFNMALAEDDIRTIKEGGLSKALAIYPSGKLATTWASIKAQVNGR